MKRMLLAVIVVLSLCGGISYGESKPPTPASPAEIQRAIRDHELVNGMTLRQANKAMGVAPNFYNNPDGTRTATWKIGQTRWTAYVDRQTATIWLPKKQ